MDVIKEIRRELKKRSDFHTKTTGQRFFKEKIKLYGVKTSIVTKIAKEFYNRIKDLPKEQIFSLCDELLESGYMEESFIAFKWAEYLKIYELKDFNVMERWLKNNITNWASCDTFCTHALGSFIEQYPEKIKHLKKWTKYKNRWMRRASAVALIAPIRHGKFLKDVFEIAELLLEDQDDLVQKGYGWMLKEASGNYQKDVFNFVMKHKKSMPRTALRYAIEKMPKELKIKAMQK